MRQLAAYEKAWNELNRLGCSVIVASNDTLEQAREVAQSQGLTFPMAYGFGKEDADAIGAWWSEAHGGHPQPAEFLLGRGGTVLGSMYASGPVGRMSVEEVLRSITSREKRRREEEGREK